MDGKTVADGLYRTDSCIRLQQIGTYGHYYNGYQRPRNLFAETGRECNDYHTQHTYQCRPSVYRMEIFGIYAPFLNEVCRHLGYAQSEQVLDLGGEDGQRNTAGKSYNNRVRNVLDDSSQMEDPQQYQEHTCQDGGNGQSLYAILLYDAIDDDNKGSRRTTYLYTASTESRNGKPGDNRRYDSLFRRNS